MIASENSPTGSCVVRIPKAFWTEDVQQKPFELKLIAMEEMSWWGLEHALGGSGGMLSVFERWAIHPRQS